MPAPQTHLGLVGRGPCEVCGLPSPPPSRCAASPEHQTGSPQAAPRVRKDTGTVAAKGPRGSGRASALSLPRGPKREARQRWRSGACAGRRSCELTAGGRAETRGHRGGMPPRTRQRSRSRGCWRDASPCPGKGAVGSRSPVASQPLPWLTN